MSATGDPQNPPPPPRPVSTATIKLKKPGKLDLTEETELLRHLNSAHAKIANADTAEEGVIALSAMLVKMLKKEEQLKKRLHLLAAKEEELQSEISLCMRESEDLTASLLRKEVARDQLCKLQETLGVQHSDQGDRLEEIMRNKKSENDERTSLLMGELSQYSVLLEETSKGILESARRNDELKTEFREFYDMYQKEDSDFKAKVEDLDAKIAQTDGKLAEAEAEVTNLKQLQGPLMDKLKTAVKKEEDLKVKLREQAVKFEMFQGLLQESNGKFTLFKNAMDSNSATTKRFYTENTDLQKKIAVLKASIDPIEAENALTKETIAKVSKQTAQLTLLVEKLKMPTGGGSSSTLSNPGNSSSGGSGDACS